MTIRILPALAGLLLSVTLTGAAGAADCDGRPCIAIGTYNIKTFGKGPADTPAEIASLAKRIDEQGEYDVIALVEIDVASDDWLTGLLPDLQARGFEVSGISAFGGSDPGRQQHVVLMHRTANVTQIGDFEDLPTSTIYDVDGCTYDSVRPAVTARYAVNEGGFDFRVFGIHFKSNRPVNGDADCDDRIRTLQFDQLAEAIARYETDEGESDHIITGDFNTPFDRPETAALRDLGYASQIDFDCKSAKIWNCSYVGSPPRIFDHVVVDASTVELVPDSGEILQVGMLATYKKTQSDHVPVRALFYTDMPDDD